MASLKKAVLVIVLTLRLIVLIFLLLSLKILVTDSVTLYVLNKEGSWRRTKITFDSFYAYRYVLSVAVIGSAYTILQIPFAVFNICKGNDLLGSVIFIDSVFSLVFATGVGAGFGLTIDLQRLIHDSYEFSLVDKYYGSGKDIDNSFTLASISVGMLLIATVCMAIATLISMYAFAKK